MQGRRQFFQVTGRRRRSSRVLIYHPPAPAPKSFNKRLRQIPYCDRFPSLRAVRSTPLLFFSFFLLFFFLLVIPGRSSLGRILANRRGFSFSLSLFCDFYVRLRGKDNGHGRVISYVRTIPPWLCTLQRLGTARNLLSKDCHKSAWIGVRPNGR